MQSHFKKFKKNQNLKRIDILKSWMTSFVVTATVVIAAVVFVPKSAKVDVIKITSFESMITYQMQITDEDMSLSLDTLHIQLKSPLEVYKNDLKPGMNTGAFVDLKPNTIYDLEVYGSKGFGLERLYSQKVQTQVQTGSAILKYTFLESSDMDYDMQIDTALFDKDDTYLEVVLYVGYMYLESPQAQYTYQVFDILDTYETFFMSNIPKSNVKIHMYIQAFKNDETYDILDELYTFTPYEVPAYVYLSRIGSKSIHLDLYHYAGCDVTYEIEVYDKKQRIAQRKVLASEAFIDRYDKEIIFKNLKSEKYYDIYVYVTYKDPQDLRVKKTLFYETSVKTLSTYGYDLNITYGERYLIADMALYDLENQFDVFYYELYELSESNLIYLGSGYVFFEMGQDSKTASLSILIPEDAPYHIIIGIRKQSQYLIHKIVFENINE